MEVRHVGPQVLPHYTHYILKGRIGKVTQKKNKDKIWVHDIRRLTKGIENALIKTRVYQQV